MAPPETRWHVLVYFIEFNTDTKRVTTTGYLRRNYPPRALRPSIAYEHNKRLSARQDGVAAGRRVVVELAW